MPKVCEEYVRGERILGEFPLFWIARISVDADGWFYCYVPPSILPAISRSLMKRFSVSDNLRRKKKPHCFGAPALNQLTAFLHEATALASKPEEVRTNIIAYNLESHVSFAEQPDGTIVPNAGFPDAKWSTMENRGPYGGHHAQRQADGGYAMIVGAKALTKIVRTCGDKSETTYERYYGLDEDGDPNDHFEKEHPAGLLNSWACFSLPGTAKEMPYTDEAALFFHNLMLAMAHMQRQIQSMVADEAAFIELANSGHALLPGPKD